MLLLLGLTFSAQLASGHTRETAADARVRSHEVMFVGLDATRISPMGVSLQDLADQLGTPTEEVDRTLNNSFMRELKAENPTMEINVISSLDSLPMAGQYAIVVENYEVAQQGYPYHNFLHVISYAVYDAAGSCILEARQQFATIECTDTDQLQKQLRKAAKKVVSKLG